jgi:hypothetical protein
MPRLFLPRTERLQGTMRPSACERALFAWSSHGARGCFGAAPKTWMEKAAEAEKTARSRRKTGGARSRGREAFEEGDRTFRRAPRSIAGRCVR